MKNLSNLEAALLISIKINPDRHQVFHAGSVCATIFEIGRAVTALKNLKYITENDRGRFHVNQAVLDRLNTEVMHEENSSGVVHRSDSDAPTISVDVSKPLPTKPTPESLLQQLAEFGKRGAVAQTLANAYGVRGIAIAQMLRRLREEGKVTKHETFWFIATQDDAVTHIEVPYENRRPVTDVTELQSLIKLQKGWFTAKESFDELSKAFIVEWSFFYGVFMGMADEGHFNVKENGVLVSYEHSSDAENQHANCRWDDVTSDPVKFDKTVQDYIYLVQQGGSKRWSLDHCVEVTKIQSGLLLHWFELAGFDITDIDSIGKKEAEFTAFDQLDSVKVQEFIGAEGCRVTAFMKAFNLDPDTTEKVCSLLELVKVARYDAENKFLMLPQTKKIVEAPEAQAPRVTSDPETGEDTIQIQQIPNAGCVFLEVHCDPTREVATQYQYGNSLFNGMPITPTDDAGVYLLHVPEAFKQEAVDVEGMYENVRVDQRDDGLPVMLPAHGAGDYRSAHFEKRAEEQKENPPEKMYFNGEKPKGEISAEARTLVDGLLAALAESKPTEPAETSDEGEHSSMLQIDRPLLGMHLFRVSEHALVQSKPLPETVEDENSPYFGCKITACTGDQVGYATVTVEPWHPMWEHVVGHPVQRVFTYARNDDGTLIIDTDENGRMCPRLLAANPARRFMYTNDLSNGVTAVNMPPDEDIFGGDADPLSPDFGNEPDGDPEAEEYAANLEPHLKHLLRALAGVPTKEEIYDMLAANNEAIRVGSASVGVKGNPANGCGAPLPVRTVKPEWISGLALIADQHKRSSATHKLLMEIKEYLEK